MPRHALTWPAFDGAHTAASATGEGMDGFLRTSNTRTGSRRRRPATRGAEPSEAWTRRWGMTA